MNNPQLQAFAYDAAMDIVHGDLWPTDNPLARRR